jgi:hypothetical protein
MTGTLEVFPTLFLAGVEKLSAFVFGGALGLRNLYSKTGWLSFLPQGCRKI